MAATTGRHAGTLLAVVLALTAPARAQSPRDLVARAAAAMGGEAALRAVSTVTYDYYSATFALGQSELPESPLRATVTSGLLIHDYRGGRRVYAQQTRLLTGAVQRQRLLSTATIGVNEINGQPAAAAPGTVAAQLRSMRTGADRLILAALDEPSAVTAVAARSLRGALCQGVRIAARDTATIYFDAATGLPLVIETVTDDPILGDRVTQLWYTRWQPAGAIKVARQLDALVNGQLNQHAIITGVSLDAAVPESLAAIPDSIARVAQPAGTPAPSIALTLNQLGPSVWRAEWNNYHSLVVEQPDQLVVVEMPQSTERSRALLDTLRARFPGKRVGTAVMTHYHWDHSGGLREFIAEGIPVVTLEANAGFVRQVAAARRTVQPDLQAQRRRTPTVRTFTDSLVIGSGESRVVLYRQPTIHAEGVLSAYVPGARVLFTSDVVNPPATLTATTTLNAAGSAELVALARARGLSVEQYAGGHGALVTWADIERAAAPAAEAR